MGGDPKPIEQRLVTAENVERTMMSVHNGPTATYILINWYNLSNPPALFLGEVFFREVVRPSCQKARLGIKNKFLGSFSGSVSLPDR